MRLARFILVLIAFLLLLAIIGFAPHGIVSVSGEDYAVDHK